MSGSGASAMITENQVFLYPANTLVRQELRTIAREAREVLGSEQAAIQFLGWRTQEYAQIYDFSPLTDMAGRTIISISFKDLGTQTRAQVQQEILYRIVARALERFSGIWSDYQIAHFLHLEV